MKTPRIPARPSDAVSSSAKRAEPSTQKPFSKVLESRRGKDKSSRESEKLQPEERKPSSLRGKLEDEEAVLQLLPLFGSSVAQTGQANPQVASAQPAIPKQPIQALANEIWHGVNARGQEQVDIHLNSKVLDGLKIQIVRDTDRLNIRFESASDAVSQLLTRNVGALTESLVAHGVRVGQIRVNDPDTARWMSRKPQSRSRSGGQGRRGQS
ncbi:MAG: flagellar hook-length control protein FliK [Acidobacteria bacterium]|nr:flagellar hook-length control protein FliK [Acidobacteriota bacterium]MCI0719775.1 flagellar hook-length control protein FliK [Acidobacteriota bacterium]